MATVAEAKRQGEVAGSQHAVGWIDRNSPNEESLETAYVSESQSIADVAKWNAADKWYGGGKKNEKLVKAFVAGYVEAWKKEILREMGRVRNEAIEDEEDEDDDVDD